MRLAHIAVVTTDLERATALYESLGYAAGPAHDVVEQYPEEAEPHRYRAAALRPPADGRPVIWLMEPVGAAGPLARFLRTHGPGFHHLGFKTEDIAAEVSRLRQRGMTLLREPHDFPDDREIRALLSPRECGGVLIEVVQERPA